MSKSIGKNAVYNVIYKCLNVVFPLITTVYVSRILMPEGVGKVASAQNIVQYFVVLAALGLPTYGIKAVAESRNDIGKLSKTFSELFTINAVSTLLCSIAYIVLILFGDYFQSRFLLSIVVGFQLFANIINIDWFYQGIEDYRYIMYRSLFVKFLALVFVLFFVKTSNDFVLYALISTLSLVANYIFNVYNLRKYIILTSKDLHIVRHLRPILILLAASIAIEVYTLVATTLLTVLKGDAVVGYYTNAGKMTGVARMLIISVCAVFLPRMNYYRSIGENENFIWLAKRGLLIILTLSIPIAILLILLADDCVLILFGNEFYPSITTMRLLALSIVTVAISNFTGYQILVTVGEERKVLYSTIIGAVTNLTLNLVLIEILSQNGAALSYTLSEAIVSVYQFYCIRKYVVITNWWITLRGILIPSIVMIVVILFVKSQLSSYIIETMTCFIIGMGIYLVLSIKCGNVFLREGYEKAKSVIPMKMNKWLKK